jgi:quercetin dioxygenase-like cupin family protein
MTQRRAWFSVGAGVVLVGFAAVILAQNPASPNPGITRSEVAHADLSAPGRETQVVRVEIAPGAQVGWHTHPGEEISYLTDGEVTLYVAGQPPRKVSAGQAMIVPMGAVHNAKNEGTVPAKLIAVYVVEKGKPLRTAAPEPAN